MCKTARHQSHSDLALLGCHLMVAVFEESTDQEPVESWRPGWGESIVVLAPGSKGQYS